MGDELYVHCGIGCILQAEEFILAVKTVQSMGDL